MLRRDGFGESDAVLAATTLTGWASGFAVFEARDRAGAAAPPAMPSADERFEYGLAVLLDGIEAGTRRTTGEERPKEKRHKRDGDKPKEKRHKRDGDKPRGEHRPK